MSFRLIKALSLYLYNLYHVNFRKGEKMKQNLDEIFDKIETLLKEYENPLVVRSKVNGKREYHLWSEKNLEIAGRKRKDVYFAGIIIQKNYVGFYYMPIYSDVGLKDVYDENLLKLLKGKSCFHIKKYDETIEKELKKALEIGYDLYLKRAWI